MFEGLFGGKNKDLKPEQVEKAEPIVKVEGKTYQIGSKVFVRRGADLRGPLESDWTIKEIKEVADQEGARSMLIDINKINEAGTHMQNKSIPFVDFQNHQIEGDSLTKEGARVNIDGMGTEVIYEVASVEEGIVNLVSHDPVQKEVIINTPIKLAEYLNKATPAVPAV